MLDVMSSSSSQHYDSLGDGNLMLGVEIWTRLKLSAANKKSVLEAQQSIQSLIKKDVRSKPIWTMELIPHPI